MPADHALRSSRPVTRSELVRDFRALGVRSGGILMVHTRTSAIGWVVGGSQAVVEALLETLGPDGTLMAYAGWQDDPWDLAAWPAEWQQAYRAELPPFDPELSEADHDMIQSLILAIYPLLKNDFALSFAQIGLITLTYQLTASLLQPFIGMYTDRYPQPRALSIGMGFTLVGLVLLSIAPNYGTIIIAAALVGAGSSIFHPESSRVARLASGGQHGLAQSIFQVGGNAGTAVGPLLAAWVIIPYGRSSVAWFSLAALVAILVLWRIGDWYLRHHGPGDPSARPAPRPALPAVTGKVVWAMAILVALVFSKYFYLTSLSSYYTFYLISKFHLSIQSAQLHLFGFLFAIALGTLVGGPVGDRIGRKRVIWVSILGVAPFTLVLPYADATWTSVLVFIIGLTIASAFSAILVFGQELLPGRVGTVSGLFFGLAFGVGGIGAALLGELADMRGIEYVYSVCSFLPLIGLLTAFLPDLRGHHVTSRPAEA